MPEPIPDFFKILKTFVKREVDFVVVGGVCAVLHGAPISTFDLDLVHSRTPDNLHRLLSVLDKLNAFFRERKDLRIVPDLSHVSSTGHQLLMTKFGPLDLLGTIGNGLSYEDIIDHTEEINVSGFKLRILSLEKLIQIKEYIARGKDKAVLPILKRTLEEKLKLDHEK